MASVSTTKNGSRRLYYFDADGGRRTLYLGKVTKKQAESIGSHIEAIVSAKAARTSMALDDAIWLGEIGDTLHAKLVKHGLAIARQTEPSDKEDTQDEVVKLEAFVLEYIAKQKAKPGTKWVYNHTRRNLVAFFGADKELSSITTADADDFRLWLDVNEQLAEATLRKRCSVARQFFRRAVKAKIIAENPFGEMKNVSVGSSPEERVYFLEPADFEKVVRAMPAKLIDLRTVFALARWAGMRCWPAIKNQIHRL